MISLSKKILFLLLTFGITALYSGLAKGEPVQEIRNVLLIGWDGVQREHLMELLSDGQLPNLEKLISEGSLVYTEVTTGKTETMPGWSEILTGYSAIRLGITSNRDYKSITKGYTIFERLEEHFGRENITTIFIGGKRGTIGSRRPHELCYNCVAGKDDHSGRQRTKTFGRDKQRSTARTEDGGPRRWVFRDGEPFFNCGKTNDFHMTRLGAAENVAAVALDALDRYYNKPFFAFFHFKEPDVQAHQFGENSLEYSEGLRIADYWLGIIIEKLKSLGIYDKTTIFVTTDHGMDEGGFGHNDAPHMFLATNSKRTIQDGDRKDITPTLLEEYGIDLGSISPPLDGKSLFKEELFTGQYKGYNLLMISITNVAAEHMSLYGYKRKTAPNLDKWAQDAIVFENAFSHASWTLPVATSLFTSLYPYTHKVMDRYRTNLLNKHIKTLPEILRENNYKTVAFTGGLDYRKEFGHMRGFEDTNDNSNFTGFEIILKQAKDWLAWNSEKKFFLFIQGYTAHIPFTPPERFKGAFSNPEGKNITVDTRFSLRGIKNSDNVYVARYTNRPDLSDKEREIILTQDDIDYLRDLYDEEILYVDSMIGDFLNSLDKKILHNTIILIFSEHGEMFAKHGRFGRAGTQRGTLYEDVVHIPLMIKMPPNGQGKRIKGLVQIIDIMPTVLDILGISFSQKIQGKSLLPLINEGQSINEYVYAGLPFYIIETKEVSLYRPIPIRSINESIRSHKWKLIREVRFSDTNTNKDKQIVEETFELYNLDDDPNELTNVAKRYLNITGDLKKRLKQWSKWAEGFLSVHSSTQKVPEDLLQDAIRHGYW